MMKARDTLNLGMSERSCDVKISCSLMPIQNRVVALIFRVAAACLISSGIILATGMHKGIPKAFHFLFFTMQSNIWVAVFVMYLAGKTLRDLIKSGIRGTSDVDPSVRGSLTLAITVTHLVYHFLLRPSIENIPNRARIEMGFATYRDNVLHYGSCWCILADYFLFAPKNRYRWFDPLKWFVLPLIYFVVILVSAEVFDKSPFNHSRYPYFFIDVDIFGFMGVIKNVLGICAGFVVIAYVFYLLDKFEIRNFQLCFGPEKAKQE